MRPIAVKRALLVVPLMFAALLVLPTAPAWACSCAAVTAAQAVDRADVVFRGSLEEVDEPAGLHEPSSGAQASSYRFTVAEIYRGTAAPTTWVGSAADGASCGLEGMEPGREYLVFAQERGEGLWASLCDGTAPASASFVGDVVAAAGDGHAPVPVATAAPAGQSPAAQPPGAAAPVSERAWLVPLLGGLALALLLAASLVFVFWRGRRRV